MLIVLGLVLETEQEIKVALINIPTSGDNFDINGRIDLS